MNYQKRKVHERPERRYIPPLKDIEKAREKIKTILSKSSLTANERNLLEYIKVTLLFRKHCQVKTRGAENPYENAQIEAMGRINLSEKEIIALNFSLVRDRKNLSLFLPEKELDNFCEKIKEKLNKSPP